MHTLKIGAQTLLTMCAAHFISGFTPADIERGFFAADLDAAYGGEPVEISYLLTICGQRVTEIAIETFCDRPEVLTGNLAEARCQAVGLINGFLAGYETEVSADEGFFNPFDDRGKELYYERKYSQA